MNKLSVVMSFLNEKEEVRQTVSSIRNTVGNRVDIVVVNDASDLDYNYEKDLEGFNVRYYTNKNRVGAAQGKEKAVQLCETPYFIIIDAHMRFYDSSWLEKLITELDKNPNQLLCCQTKVLTKDNDGIVVDKGDMGVYGAYITFNSDELIPNIKWNVGKISTMLNTRQIPAVLGASYCTSKEYWKKIKGLQGLIHYGCEEAYISIKAWLEGGGCKLIEDIIIGHIYRKNAPYQIDTVLNNYNYYFIANTLLSPLMKAKAHAVGKVLNQNVYQLVQKELKKHKNDIIELKEYYAKTFVAHDFSYIIDINNVLTPKDTIILEHDENRLHEIIDNLQNSILNENNISIYNGKCGVMLTLALYANLYNNKKSEEKAASLFNDILCTISPDVPITFNYGLCGIGWSVIYLVHKGIVDYNDVCEELRIIDSLVMERSPSRINNFSISNGIGGILIYVMSRMSVISNCSERPFDKKYLKELNDAAVKLCDTEDKDWRILTFALMFIECYSHSVWNVNIPQIEDIFNLPTFLPKEEIYQRHGIEGDVGFALFLIDRQQRSNQFFDIRM